jgi:hypothetical protein
LITNGNNKERKKKSKATNQQEQREFLQVPKRILEVERTEPAGT